MPLGRIRPPSSPPGCRVGAIAVLLLAASFGLADALAAVAPPSLPRLPARGNRAPLGIAISPDGRHAYVTEEAEGTVAVIDTRRREVSRRISCGGRPAGVVVSPDGAWLAVACRSPARVVTARTVDGERIASKELAGEPHGLAVSPTGDRVFVALSQLDEVIALSPPDLTEPKRGRVGRKPRAIALAQDGETLIVANMAGGSASIVDTATMVEMARVPLRGVNVRGLAVTREGTEAYFTHMPAFNAKPTSDPQEVWHNLIEAIGIQGSSSFPAENQWLDFIRLPGSGAFAGSPDPEGIVLDAAGRHAWIAVGGRDVVTRITIHDRTRQAIWPMSQREIPVGLNPRGLALTPDGSELWCTNTLGNSVTVIDAATSNTLQTIDLGPATRRDPTLYGQYLFRNAGLTRSQRFTCNSCHPDGGADGLSWTFTHVQDGVTRRNTRDLRTGVEATPPFRWSGADAHLRDFVDAEVTGLLGGPRPTPEQSAALIQAISALPPPENPYREGGRMTAEARAGEALFLGKAGCESCHSGSRKGGTGARAWVGTSPAGLALDIPHLVGVFDSPPYLHDGSAATLEDIFLKRNLMGAHGKASELSPAELAALVRYLQEL